MYSPTRIAVPGFILCAALSSMGFAQTLADLKPGAPVRVEVVGFTKRLSGTLVRSGSDTLVISFGKRDERSFPIAALTRVETPDGRNAVQGGLVGAAIGAGAGMLVGGIVASIPAGFPVSQSGGADRHGAKHFVQVTAAGLAIGTTLGLAIGRQHWTPLRLPVTVAFARGAPPIFVLTLPYP